MVLNISEYRRVLELCDELKLKSWAPVTSGFTDRIFDLCETLKFGKTDLAASRAVPAIEHPTAPILEPLQAERGLSQPSRLAKGETIIWLFERASHFVASKTAQLVARRDAAHSFADSNSRDLRQFPERRLNTSALSFDDIGDLMITDQNAIFVGPQNILRITGHSVSAVTAYADGIEIINSGNKPASHSFILDDPWIAANAIARFNRL